MSSSRSATRHYASSSASTRARRASATSSAGSQDGPSAGITIASAIACLVRHEAVAEAVGMSAELTLTGEVLPIGGLREKVLAAQRYGLKRIVMPRDNEPDLEELPEETREELEFFPVDSIAEVFEVAFGKGKAARPRAAASGERQAALPSV